MQMIATVFTQRDETKGVSHTEPVLNFWSSNTWNFVGIKQGHRLTVQYSKVGHPVAGRQAVSNYTNLKCERQCYKCIVEACTRPCKLLGDWGKDSKTLNQSDYKAGMPAVPSRSWMTIRLDSNCSYTAKHQKKKVFIVSPLGYWL